MNVSVIGAGLMGCGIAQVFLVAGHQVVLHDKNDEVLQQATARIENIFADLEIPPDLSGLRLDGDLAQATAKADLVIEAVIEDLTIKQEIFREISAVTGAGTILATNTSAIPVSQIAKGVKNPGRFVGAHFWNPPWAVDLVEVVQGSETSPEVVTQLIQILEAVGMKPVHVKRDIPGFIGNRLQHALKREAIALVEQGVCDAETIDTVVKKGFGMRLATLGPLEQSDLVGLDLTLRIHEVLIPDLDVTPRPADLLVAKVAKGELGMRNGKGFRDWTPESAARVRQQLTESLKANGQDRISRLQQQGAGNV